ncbi:hypothetical protein K1719_016251 [Acacia pycnantha]|nr:hypothetical protein K1719_016251 [Acacia pycnantha]
MAPEELSESSLLAALDGARIVYFDVRLHETALVIARKLWNMVSSLDHKYCHQVKYENTLSSTLRSEIPSWFPNKDYIPSDVYRSKYELIVDIPQHVGESE